MNDWARVLQAVKKFPQMTSREIASNAGLGRYSVARRLPELEDKHLVERGEKRKCMLGKIKAITWVAV